MRSARTKPRLVSTPVALLPVVVHAGHFAVLDDVDAERARGARVSPGNRIVADRSAAPLHERAEDRKPPRATRLHLGTESLERRDIHQLGVDPGQTHGIPAPRKRGEVIVGQCQIDDAPRAVHHVVIELLRQALVAAQRVLVKIMVLRQQVVRAHDGGVAPDVAVAEQALLEYGDAPNAMIARQVKRRREAVAAGADDHHVVGILQLASRPQRSPVAVPGEPGAKQRPGGVSRHGPVHRLRRRASGILVILVAVLTRPRVSIPSCRHAADKGSLLYYSSTSVG